ncbi:MAG: AAA family ATPase [Xanthobacteraceae bacterium]|jgi:putative DNA primase/helicase
MQSTKPSNSDFWRSFSVGDVPPEEVAWLWPGRIALGKLTIIGGHPGISKSTLTIDMAARVTVGGEWPCREGTAPKGSVVMVSGEDEVADTIHPPWQRRGQSYR